VAQVEADGRVHELHVALTELLERGLRPLERQRSGKRIGSGTMTFSTRRPPNCVRRTSCGRKHATLNSPRGASPTDDQDA
jgi:hypothetical protein